MIKVGKTLSPIIKVELTDLIKENAYLFAWSAVDMPGIDPATITHKLNVIEGSKPVKQKKRSMAPEKEKAAEEKVQKLLEAGFIEPASTLNGWPMLCWYQRQQEGGGCALTSLT